MRVPLLTRAACAAAAAVIATAGAIASAGAAGAATAAVRQPTHLSIVKRTAVEHHEHVTVIAGQLTSRGVPVAGRLVILDAVTVTHNVIVVGHERSGLLGGVAFAVSPKLLTHYNLVFLGGPALGPTESRAVAVRN